MIFLPTPLVGPVVIDLNRREDERGFFARTFCVREFAAQGIHLTPVQANLAATNTRGAVRGLHYQVAPSTETKLVRCTRGAIFDVVVDLRPDSPTYGRHFSIELSADNQRALYVPALFAHGYQTLRDHCEVSYLVSDFYDPPSERGLRYDDPQLAIAWPLAVTLVSDKDASWPLLAPASVNSETPP